MIMFQMKYIGAQRTYSKEEYDRLQSLLNDAIEAEERFGVDECERYAEELRRKKGEPNGE